MTKQVLKDGKFRTIGYVETRSDGVQVLKDAKFRTCGYYEPKTDVTKDAKFRVIGHGNLLTSLIPPNQH